MEYSVGVRTILSHWWTAKHTVLVSAPCTHNTHTHTPWSNNVYIKNADWHRHNSSEDTRCWKRIFSPIVMCTCFNILDKWLYYISKLTPRCSFDHTHYTKFWTPATGHHSKWLTLLFLFLSIITLFSKINHIFTNPDSTSWKSLSSFTTYKYLVKIPCTWVIFQSEGCTDRMEVKSVGRRNLNAISRNTMKIIVVHLLPTSGGQTSRA